MWMVKVRILPPQPIFPSLDLIYFHCGSALLGHNDPAMNKRTFFKLLAVLVSNRAISPVFAWAAGERFTNWAGNLVYGTDRLYSANSLQQVRDYVKRESNLKVLGTRHCFNNIADSTHNLLSLKAINKVVDLDTRAATVTVSAGITYGQLSPYLHSKGFALHNLASLPHISVAGACSTATHGSGEKYGNLPLNEVKEHFDAIASSAYSVSLFTDWQKQRMNEVWIKSRVEGGHSFDAGPAFFGAKLATRNLHPIAELSAENCTEQMGVPGPWFERLPHFRMGFTPSAGKELQSEYFVPRQHALEAILAVERLRDPISPSLLISAIRAVAADNLWLSPCYKQPCVTIHFTWKPDWPAVSKLLPAIEKELAPFNARPHWGKLFSTSPVALRTMYEKLPDFTQLSTKYDPHGKFRNEFLNKNIFGT